MDQWVSLDKASTKEEAVFSETQLQWLREKLAENADVEKPIFVTVHQALKGTFPRSDDGWSVGEQDAALKEILKDYPQVVYMSGHIHNGFGSSPILETEYGTLVDIPSFAYNELGLLDGQVGYEVDVYADRIVFRARDYKNDTWLTQYDTTIQLKDKEAIEGVRNELSSLYEQYAELQQGEYDENRWEVFTQALSKAKELLDKNSMNEQALQQALEALQNAIDFLPLSEELLLSTAEKGCTVTASSYWWSWAEGPDPRYVPEKMIDRDFTTRWNSDSEPYSTEPDPRPTAVLSWEEPQTVSTILAYGSVDWDHVSVYFNGNEEESVSISVRNDAVTPNVIQLDTPKENVTSISFSFEDSPPSGMGFYEVEVYAPLPQPEVDKSELQALYDRLVKVTDDGYTDESWSAFQLALEDAKSVLDNDKALQENVDKVKESLQSAYDNLEYTSTEIVNKALLQKTYDYALTLSTEGVTESAKTYFEMVLAEAKAVLDNANATQEEVDTAWDNLLVGIWGLGLTQGDKTMLEQLIAKAETMIPNQDKYVQDHWQELVDALANAKEVMADGDAMAEDVEPAADALTNAILAQRYKANKSILEDLINKANSLDLSQYSAESVAVFKAALAEANLVLANESLSEDDQEIVDAAVQKLDAAIENLSASEDGDTSKSEGGDEGAQMPATGDYSDTTVLFTGVFAMMILASLVIIWRKKQNDM